MSDLRAVEAKLDKIVKLLERLCLKFDPPEIVKPAAPELTEREARQRVGVIVRGPHGRFSAPVVHEEGDRPPAGGTDRRAFWEREE